MNKDTTHAFIVRIWKDSADEIEEKHSWRGSIDHVGSQERLYFYHIDGVLRFIQDKTGIDKRKPNQIWQIPLSWVRNGIIKIKKRFG